MNQVPLTRDELVGRFRQNPLFFEALFEGGTSGILVLDRECRILAMNRTVEEWLQGSQQKPGSLKCHEALFGCNDPCRTNPAGCPVARTLSSRKPEGPVNLPRRFRQGEEQYLESRAFPMLDPRGQVQTVVEILKDVTSERLLSTYQEEANLRDPLTGVYNRTAFHLFLNREIKRAQRQNDTLSLCLLDLDSFKDFNEKKGNEAGDELLISLARILVAQTRREVDGVFRLEADTFSLILPEADDAQALRVAERIRIAFTSSGSAVTLSVAICQAEVGENADGLYHRAADRLYRAKKSGGSRIL